MMDCVPNYEAWFAQQMVEARCARAEVPHNLVVVPVVLEGEVLPPESQLHREVRQLLEDLT